eukprot:s1038_g7.t1
MHRQELLLLRSRHDVEVEGKESSIAALGETEVDPIVENEEHQQDDAEALRPHGAADSTAPTPGTPSLKALAAGGASADEPASRVALSDMQKIIHQ